MSRPHQARRLALQGLCCLDVQGDAPAVIKMVGEFIEDSDQPPETALAARQMVERTLADRDHCDELLARHARRWSLSRLAMVDRNILRMAVSELRNESTPFKVVIAEALKLAHEFSTSESPRFINGVLDAVAGEVLGGAPPAADPPDDPEPAP